jgi:extradiol dioxygenase
MKILSLGYLGFDTTRHEEWLDFGPRIMGLGLGHRGPDGAVYLKMDDRKYRFAFHPSKIDQVKYIGWELQDDRAFEAAIEELERKNVRYELASEALLAERCVSGMAALIDPAGFRHEIYYSQEFWPNSFIPGRPITGFLAEELGLGHMILGVPAFRDELRDFALGVLGFSIFASYPFRFPDGTTQRLEFYKCNLRTHVFGYIPYPGRRGIQHVGVDLKSLDDVGLCLDLCEKHQVPISQRLGRNTMDDSVTFYFRTPTGFEIEYGAGPRLLDPDKVLMQKPSHAHYWGHQITPENQATTLEPV